MTDAIAGAAVKRIAVTIGKTTWTLGPNFTLGKQSRDGTMNADDQLSTGIDYVVVSFSHWIAFHFSDMHFA